MSEVNFRLLFDEDSFVQTLAFIHGDGSEDGHEDCCFTGFGTVGNRLVFAAVDSGEKRSVVHGSNFAVKAVRSLEAAVQHKVPFIIGFTGSYLDVSGGAGLLCDFSDLIVSIRRASGKIPLICVIDGQCFGTFAVIAAMCDFVFLCGGTSAIAASSDTAVNLASGRIEAADLLKFDADYSEKNSVIVSGISSDIEGLRSSINDLFRYLPDSVFSGAPSDRSSVSVSGALDSDIAALKGRELAASLCDGGTFYELSASFGPEAFTGFGQVFGRTVGIIGFDTEQTSGLAGANAIVKLFRFTDFCATFRVPAVKLLDFTGVKSTDRDAFKLPGLLSKFIFRNGEKHRSISVVTGSACGELVPAFILKRRYDAGNLAIAWKGSYIDAINPCAAALMKFGEDIRNDPDPAAARKKYIELYKNEFSRAELAAEKGLIDDVIDPSETRLRIASYLSILQG
ncbi:MAG: hypothetical protein J5950_10205 [Clostridia bacterium]|nr:hypothetical protein [Clostridia bacterium]